MGGIVSRGLRIGYGRRIVLDGVELEIGRGEFIAVIGPNASGKSTLLKTLASLLNPLGGVVYLDGRDVRRWGRRELAKKLGVVLTERINPGMMTVFEVVALGRTPYTDALARLGERDRQAIMSSLELVGAKHLARRRFNELSDGERQKVMIARALAQEPSVIILDEPTSHLDARNRVEITLLLKRLAYERGLLVVSSMHEVELALRTADKLVVVKNGSAKIFNCPEEFIMEEGVDSLYEMNGMVGFNPIYYTVELCERPKKETRVFVVAGSGTGSPVFRMLKRNGYPVATGILHENDVDHQVAQSLGIEIVSEKPYEPISDEKFKEALEKIRESDVVIYTSPPIGSLNKRNKQLVQEAEKMGRAIIQVCYREENKVVSSATTCNLAYLPKLLEKSLPTERSGVER